MAFLLEDEGRAAHQVQAATGEELLTLVQAFPVGDVGVFGGLAGLDWGDFQAMDAGRSRLVCGARIVLVGTAQAVAQLRAHAPNLWSWMGSREPARWTMLVDSAATEARLETLRADAGRSDEQVLAMAEKGTLPTDPRFVEWLVLLGRSDLLGG